MHVYIFDYFLNQKKYDKIVAKIETRITDLGLQGKNCHVGPLKSLKSIVTEELKNNPTTIIAIGDNKTLNEVVNAAKDSNIIIGIIPIGNNNSIADTLGITDEDQACNVLSARLIERIDIGVINNNYFIANAKIATQGTVMEINGKYTIEPTGDGEVEIINLNTSTQNSKINPNDGLFEIFINVNQKKLMSSTNEQSFIQTNRVIINNLKHNQFLIDNAVEIPTPVEIGVIKNKLSVIVGKERGF